MDEDVLHKLISIQNHGLKRGISFDDSVIQVYETEILKVPPIPFDIIVYRGGKLKEQPFFLTVWKNNILTHIVFRYIPDNIVSIFKAPSKLYNVCFFVP